ncbi:MAG: SpoIID/LytB domain-containing protein [Bacteroidales bacterium]|nr:SpoIID/LytB domain-containing protein [Bacteroidales bacterium]
MLCLTFSLTCQSIKVALFYNKQVTEIFITPYFGSYNIYVNDSLINNTSNSFLIRKINNSLELKILHDSTYICNTIHFKKKDSISALRLKVISPFTTDRYYNDDLYITNVNNNLRIINIVELEKYICGVVESETGYHNNIEYYKIQAILCRTYTLKNLGKHFDEGFNYCDDVHCQSYKGINYSKSSNTLIYEAINSTHNLVIVDTLLNLIDAVYHANCGGQTMNAEDVWNSKRYYLRSIYDPYCKKKRNTLWNKVISLNEFNNFLNDNGFKVNINNEYEFIQMQRRANLKINNESISLRKIREYFNLKSTFFNIKVKNDSVYFEGKGIGHGVGLCQDGAEQMTLEGFTFDNIINFYYKGVKIVDYHNIWLFKE